MLRRFSNLLCSKCSFYSLIFAFIISLGSVNIANAYVCFLPDSSDCAKGDTEGFWPCVGNDCPSPDGKCDASYNSNKSKNDCGAACTRCDDASSPYNGRYKCPENTCNCNEYTSTETFNECGEACKVCRISGDKNYGKYKCPAVPEWGCNPQCEDYTLTQEDECQDCDQCTNKNAPAEKQGLWKCTECDRDIYTQPIAELTSSQIANHCYEDETCGCYMKCDNCFGYEYTMQDCQNRGFDSAKNECNGKRGTVYETCCNKCDGYIYQTDLSKNSEGWSCTECPKSCEGGSKYSCGCKTGYHNDNGNCVKDDEQMYWCIYPQEFTKWAFGGGTRNGGVYNITLEGDGVNKGGGKCSSVDFYVPYGVSVSIKYTDDTVLPYSHRGWIFEPADFDDGFSPEKGYIQGSYFTENSFVATAAVLEQDEKNMTPGDSIDLSPVISKAEDRDPFIHIPDRYILMCDGYYQLVHGKWQDTFNSKLITTATWPLTSGMKNTFQVDTSQSSKGDWNSIWKQAVNSAKQNDYSGYAPGELFEPEFCEELFDCANTYGCTHSYLYGTDPYSGNRCTISDDSTCWGCYIGWHTQCVVFLESQSEPAAADYAECYDNKGKRVQPEEILTAIGKADDEAVRYVTCDELVKKVLGHTLDDE